MQLSYKKLGIVLFNVMLLFLGFKYVTPLIMPFLIGWFLAMILHPIIHKIEKSARMPRALVTLLTIILIAVSFLWLFSYAIFLVFRELLPFSEQLPMYATQFVQFIQQLLPIELLQRYLLQIQHWYETLLDSPQPLSIRLEEGISIVGQRLIALLQQMFNVLVRIVAAIPSTATFIVFSLLATFFISLDYERIQQKVSQTIPPKVQAALKHVSTNLKFALRGFVKTQLTLALISSSLTTVGLLFLQVNYALAIGIVAGMLDLVPLLGIGAIYVPWIVYMYFTKQYSLVIGLGILYGSIVLLRQFIEPKLLAISIGLHPLLALMALFIGLQLFGIWGLIAGPFVAIFLQTLYRANVFHDLYQYILSKK